MRAGYYIEKRCGVCNAHNRISIDDFKARESKEIRYFAAIAFLITLAIAAIAFFWLIYKKNVVLIWYGMFGIPFLIYSSLLIYDRSRVSIFNRLFAKR
jgi:hypothetical protein